MLTTRFGAFDGKSWEALLQQVFKRKYHSDGYQMMPASPGDFGLEGFIAATGEGFQCYCPEKHYSKEELYEYQRDKITQDLGKLKAYRVEITRRLGETKLHRWIFVTPEIDKNKLLAHARIKEKEVRGWSLPFIADDFTVLLRDGDDYLIEINELRREAGDALSLDFDVVVLPDLDESPEIYEENIRRKCESRLAPKTSSPNYEVMLRRLRQQTLESFLEGDGYLRRIERGAPTVHLRLVALINEFEKHVVEVAATWTGSPEELTSELREGLEEMIVRDLAPSFNRTNASRIARCMIARWLAICELDYG